MPASDNTKDPCDLEPVFGLFVPPPPTFVFLQVAILNGNVDWKADLHFKTFTLHSFPVWNQEKILSLLI